MKKIMLLCFLLVILLFNLFGNDYIVQDIRYYIDDVGKSDISDISGNLVKSKFIKSAEIIPNLGYTQNPVWLKFQLDLSDADENIILELDHTLIQYIDMYYSVDGREIILFSETGTNRGFASRDIPARTFAWKISTLPKTEIEVYLRIQSVASKALPVHLWTADGFYRKTARNDRILILLLGFSLALALYQISIGIQIKAGEYIVLGFVIITSITLIMNIEGFWFQYWSNPENIFLYHLINIQYSLFGLFFGIFSRSFCLENNLLRRMNIVFVIFFISASFLTFFVPQIGVLALILLIAISLELLFYFAEACLSLKKGGQDSLYYLISFSPAIFFLIIRILNNLNILPVTALFQSGVTVAVISSFYLFSMALSYRFKMIQKNSEENRELAMNRLNEMSRIKDSFLAATAHEIRTPLNGIIGLIDSVLHDNEQRLDRKDRSNLHIATLSAWRLSHLVNDILVNSRENTGEIKIEKKRLNIKQIIKIVLMNLTPLYETKQILISNQLDDDLPNITGDENRIQQILFNLIGNSLKFTHEGEIVISAEPDDGFIVIHIKDTGIGIKNEKIALVFNEYEQGGDDVVRRYGGTGLGLSVTKKLVELHGGRISIKSEYGGGTEVTFSLPVSEESNRENLLSETAVSAADYEVREDSDPEEASGRLRVVAVDDEPVNLRVISGFLPRDLYQVECFSSGKEFLVHLESSAVPDLVILDVIMPEKSGYEICTEIRKKYPMTELPVLILTAASRPEDLVQAFSSGANDYLVKPVSRSELIARVGTHIKLKSLIEKKYRTDRKLSEIDHLINLGLLVSGTVFRDNIPPEKQFEIREKAMNYYKPVVEQFLENTGSSLGTHGKSFFSEAAGNLFKDSGCIPPERLNELINTLGDTVKKDVEDAKYDEVDIDRLISEILDLVTDVMLRENQDGGMREISPDKIAEQWGLTPKELEVVLYIHKGYTNQEIADAMKIVINTVKQHVYSIFNKVGVENRTHLIYRIMEL